MKNPDIAAQLNLLAVDLEATPSAAQFMASLSDAESALLAGSGARLWNEQAATNPDQWTPPALHGEFVADLRDLANAYDQYVGSGCGQGLRWFTEWLEAGRPASPEAWKQRQEQRQSDAAAAASGRRVPGTSSYCAPQQRAEVPTAEWEAEIGYRQPTA